MSAKVYGTFDQLRELGAVGIRHVTESTPGQFRAELDLDAAKKNVQITHGLYASALATQAQQGATYVLLTQPALATQDTGIETIDQ